MLNKEVLDAGWRELMDRGRFGCETVSSPAGQVSLDVTSLIPTSIRKQYENFASGNLP